MNPTTHASDLSLHGEREREAALKAEAGVSITEAIGGIGAIVLAIIALAGVYPRYTGAVAVIAVGGSLFAEGGAIGSRYLNRLRAISSERMQAHDLGLGMTGEFIAGAAGVVLGILGLIGVGDPAVLLAAAVLAFGAALLIGTGASYRSSSWRTLPGTVPAESAAQQVLGQLTVAASTSQIMLGLATVVLGILALCGLSPYTLTMVGLLCTGCSILFTGTTLGSKAVGLMHE